MPAPRKFDDESVRETIMRRFWQDGYCATSLDGLATATGIRKGSLHNAFGNKDDLFTLALERYNASFAARLGPGFGDGDPADDIRRFLGATIARMADPDTPAGCLSTFSCLERDELPDAAKAALDRSLRMMEDVLEGIMTRAASAGMLPRGVDPRGAARHLFMLTRGMAVLHKATGDIDAVRSAAEAALCCWGIAAADRSAERPGRR